MNEHSEKIKTLLTFSIDCENIGLLQEIFSQIQKILELNESSNQENGFSVLTQKYHYIDYLTKIPISEIFLKELPDSYRINLIHKDISLQIKHNIIKIQINIFGRKSVIEKLVKNQIFQNKNINNFSKTDYNLFLNEPYLSDINKKHNELLKKQNIFIYSTESQKDLYHLELEPWIKIKEKDTKTKSDQKTEAMEKSDKLNNINRVFANSPEIYYDIIQIIPIGKN